MLKFVTIIGLCANFKLINHTDLWSSEDHKTLKLAAKRCTELYKDSCLSKFEKVDNHTYRVLCR